MSSTDCVPSPRSKIAPSLSTILLELQKTRNTEIPQIRTPRRLLLAGETVVGVMGVTGAGKSSFIRQITGNDEIEIGHGLQSMTSKVQAYTFEHGKCKFKIVDTPGFNDTYRSDSEVLEEIAQWLSDSYRKGQRLSGLIYLHRITDPKMEGSALRNLRMFRKLCGEGFLKNIILATTFWDLVNEAEGLAREQELLQADDFFKEMQERGCEVARISTDRGANLELLSRFALKQPSVMLIQRELFEGKSVKETAAASEISRELADLQHRNKLSLADVVHQATRDRTKSALEMAFTRHLEKRAFTDTMEDLISKRTQVCEEMEAQTQVDDERLAVLKREQRLEKQMYRLQEDELNERLRNLRAKADG
ncbi:hypothetical protein PV11_03318 [Exophiala sideris]|uniref:G domain-containing protein n=1 Tax=Exophiala sideris TaxID=1016849 RepID=A0A0D1XHX9_9EURO|nr:hypothetical protein PV11_03318 [Exophiala sideris]